LKIAILPGGAAVAFALAAPAQSPVITKARIGDGTWTTIEHASPGAEDGRIVSVSSCEPPPDLCEQQH
jgi:hypothetical protein